MSSNARMIEALGNPLPRRIAVFRALVLGDMLCAVPALRALRRALPEARVTLVGLPWAREFVARFSRYLDGFLEFPGYPGFPERPFDPLAFPEFLRRAHDAQFDLAIQMHGGGTLSNPAALLLAARRTAGFYVPGDYCPDPERFLPYPAAEPEVRRHLRLMEFLGIEPAGETLEFPVREEDRRELRALPEAAALSRDGYVCVHPGARYWTRRWKPERFAQTADALARDGHQIVITGSRAETSLAETVSARMTAPHVNLVGKTSLGALAALLERAKLLISNDTGVSHLAAALRAPSVVIVTSSDPARWAPIDGARHRVVYRDVPCRPCLHEVCPVGFPCGDGVDADDVVDRAVELLAAYAEEDRVRREPLLTGGR